MFGPAARFRFYGSPRNYLTALRAFISGRVTEGDDVRRLERSLERRLGAKHVIALSQGRLGIYLAVKHLVKPGSEVILSPYTIYDVVNMVISAGAVPVFCDIDRATCNIDFEKARELVNERTGAILITHLHGLMADAPKFRELCDERGIFLIEDTAQAYGARVGARMGSTIGHAGVLSFGRVKNLNGFYGGAVVTNETSVAESIRAEIATYPAMDRKTLFKRVVNCMVADVATMPGVFQLLTFWIFRRACLNDIESVSKIVDTEDHPVRRNTIPEHYLRRLTAVQARIVLSQLEQAESDTRVRIAHAMEYSQGLAETPTLQLPPVRNDGSHAYLVYPIQVADRRDFVKHMMRHGCDLSIQHYNNTADLDCFREYARDCPSARFVSRRVVLLPTYPRFGMRQVRREIEVARRYVPAAVTTAPEKAVLS